MTRGEYNEYRGWQIPENENPSDKGYFVKYQDGYESWSPEKQFDEAYRECENMTFGLAIELMKKGKKIARKGWNGKGMFLFKAENIEFTTNADLSNVSSLHGDLTNDSVVLKTADNKFTVGWVPSQSDMLSEDWQLIE